MVKVTVLRVPKKTFFCHIKMFDLFKKEAHIWIQRNTTNNFGGLFMGRLNDFLVTPDTLYSP